MEGLQIGSKIPRNKLFITCVVIFALVLTLTPVSLAQTLDQRKVNAQREVEQSQQRLEDAVERYKSACNQLEQTKHQIRDNEAQLEQAKGVLATRQARLNSRARAMYVSRSNRFIDVAVGAGDFSDFVVGLDLVKKVGGRDASLVRSVKDAKARLENAKEQLAEQKGEQEAATEEMASSKASIESELQQSKGKLAGVEEEIRQAVARRAAEASSSRGVSGSLRPNTSPAYQVIRRAVPPGAPHPGVVNVAYDQIGKPYVWGAEGPNSFDCSGLTSYCYQVGAGISITRSSYDQANCGVPVSVSELQPGDIVGFRGWGHVGIYIGNDEFIHAPSSGDYVKVSKLLSRGNFCGAVRP